MVLLRTIGNSLPPRHSANQSVVNLRFILENEPRYEDLPCHWVLNKIVDEKVSEHGSILSRLKWIKDLRICNFYKELF